MSFAAGDVVILKSGGEAMTVIGVEDDEAVCIWTGDDGDLFRETIPTVALQIALIVEDIEDEEDEDNADEEDADREKTGVA